MVRILGFGEILFDVLGSNACLGGAPLNFCAHAVRAGARAAMLTSVGKDELGEEAMAGMKKHGICTDYVSVLEDKTTGRCIVTLDDAGIPKYNLLADVAYDYIQAPVLSDKNWDVLYFGTLSLRSAYNKNTLLQLLEQKVAREVFVDMNIRSPFSTDEAVRIGLQHATLLKISDEELPAVAAAVGLARHTKEELLDYIKKNHLNVKMLILTCGAEGSVAYDLKTGDVCACDAVKTKVVSTVGAGDSFSATFVVNYLSGVSTQESLQRSAKVSAYVVSQEGAVPENMPEL